MGVSFDTGARALAAALLVVGAAAAVGNDALAGDPAATGQGPVRHASTAPAGTSAPTRPTGPPSSAPAPSRSVTLVMGGDLLWHDTVWSSAAEDHRRTGRGRQFDFDPMLASVRPLIASADVALCHEEVPFAPPGGPYRNYPVFAAPPEVAPWIARMGWDACTTASNHSLDQGYAGLVRTATMLDRVGVRHVGTFRTAGERSRPVIVTTNDGVRVGVVAGTYGLNGFPLPQGREWSVSMWDASNLLAQAHAARKAGADLVVVHLHGGTEYSHQPSPDQVALVDRLTRSPDVDLVLGEHAHVVQPITRVNGTWVVYGMGNLVAQQEATRVDTYEGVLVRFRFVERPTGGFRVAETAYVPVAWNRYAPGHPIRLHRVVGELAGGVESAAKRAWLKGVRDSVRAAVDGLGRTPGLVER